MLMTGKSITEDAKRRAFSELNEKANNGEPGVMLRSKR